MNSPRKNAKSAKKEGEKKPLLPCSAEELYVALRESVNLQSHYAELLNQYDCGQRRPFATPEAWIARLRETGDLPATIKTLCASFFAFSALFCG
jgi:hypothetical protein